MTKERAQYILDNPVYGDFRYAFRRRCDHRSKIIHVDGITEEEDRAIKKLWRSMPGSTCYFDAVQHIARGGVK